MEIVRLYRVRQKQGSPGFVLLPVPFREFVELTGQKDIEQQIRAAPLVAYRPISCASYAHSMAMFLPIQSCGVLGISCTYQSRECCEICRVVAMHACCNIHRATTEPTGPSMTSRMCRANSIARISSMFNGGMRSIEGNICVFRKPVALLLSHNSKTLAEAQALFFTLLEVLYA